MPRSLDVAESSRPGPGGLTDTGHMLELRPNCECCDRDLDPASPDVFICTYECTWCRDCAQDVLDGTCPNCGGALVRRPAHRRLTTPPACPPRPAGPPAGRWSPPGPRPGGRVAPRPRRRTRRPGRR